MNVEASEYGRMLGIAMAAIILPWCTIAQEEVRVEHLYLNGIEYPNRESSYMACALGAARYLGYEESEAWLYGACGMAFFSHVTPEGLCWSYPTDWNVDPCISLMRNAGLAQESVRALDGDVKQAVKDLLSRGVPVSAWSGGIVDEEVLIRGYADTPEGETVKYLFLNPVEENSFHPWEQLGPASRFSLVPPADDRTTVRMGLQCAVDMNRNTRRFSPGLNMVMGYEAFCAMADWLEKREVLGGEFGYNIQVWEECRRNAVAFLAEANARLNDDTLRRPLKEVEQNLAAVHVELKAIVDTFGDSVPTGKHDEFVKRLRRACEAERHAVTRIEEILELMR